MGKNLYIYCDESRHLQQAYMVLGGIAVCQDAIPEISRVMAEYREEQHMTAELKWTRVHHKKYSEYVAFIDHGFNFMQNGRMHFHSLIIDRAQLDHVSYNEGNPDLGIYKFFYTLLIHRFGRRYCCGEKGKDIRLFIKFDKRECSYKLGDMQEVLNNGMRKTHSVYTRPFRKVEAIDSKTSDIMQINDILLGAIGHHKNRRHLLPETRQAKTDLSNYIAERLQRPHLGNDTPRDAKLFTVWNLNLRPKIR